MRPQITRIKRNYDCHGVTNEEMRQRPTLLKRPEMMKTMGMLWIVILGYVKKLKIHVVCGSGTQAYDVYAHCCHENESSLSMEQMILHLLSLSLIRKGSARRGKEIGYSSSIYEASTSTRLCALDVMIFMFDWWWYPWSVQSVGNPEIYYHHHTTSPHNNKKQKTKNNGIVHPTNWHPLSHPSPLGW